MEVSNQGPGLQGYLNVWAGHSAFFPQGLLANTLLAATLSVADLVLDLLPTFVNVSKLNDHVWVQ